MNDQVKRDYKGVAVRFTKMMPVMALLTGATVWGLIWYPFRALQQAGVSGELAVTLTYGCALIAGLVWFRPRPAETSCSWLLAALGLTAGWANVGFTLGVVYGDVMRVVLLFYLAPVWTVLFARWLLAEKSSAVGYGLIVLALAGALIMLWQPEMGWPTPRSAAEWIGLSAGVAFALSNVLARKASNIAIPLKVLAIFAGGVAVGAMCMMFTLPSVSAWTQAPRLAVPLLLLLSVVILSVNVAVQYGLANVGANRAIVIYLFELVVTAISAWWLAGELLTLREWCGGAMIIAAGLLSDRVAHAPPPHAVAK